MIRGHGRAIKIKCRSWRYWCFRLLRVAQVDGNSVRVMSFNRRQLYAGFVRSVSFSQTPCQRRLKIGSSANLVQLMEPGRVKVQEQTEGLAPEARENQR